MYYETEEDVLCHYGIIKRSGRYPWGSGKDPFQRTPLFYNRVQEYKKQGLTVKEICEAEQVNSTEYRMVMSIGGSRIRAAKIAYAKSAKADGKSNVQIAKELSAKYHEDIGDTTVASLLNADREARMNKTRQTADELKKILDSKDSGMIDVGTGVERELGISNEKMKTALYMLEAEGYNVYKIRVPQATQKGQGTITKILAKPDIDRPKIEDLKNIDSLKDYTSDNNGDTIRKAFQYPASLDSKRLMIRYADQGGVAKDGVVEIRRGVKDLSLGESNYSQVRILVDGDRYIKGMAVYSDGHDMPDGVDLIFNTNKDSSVPKRDVLKSTEDNLKKDPSNPFGSSIKEGFGSKGGQSYYIGDDGKEHLSLINKRSDAGDWEQWSKELPSQFLSKQPKSLIKRQLDLAEAFKESEFDDIMEITNPTIKKQMLEEFADKCDKAAVDLKAAPLPGQKYQVILPLTSIKDNEIYAPNYADGTELALIRYPHGGTFEIPIVKVNNRNTEGKNVIGNESADAVGISHNVAQRLSGADFDGDTVMVIPLSEKVRVATKDPLKGLKGFDPSLSYGPDPIESKKLSDESGEKRYIRNGCEYKLMTKAQTQNEMGKISNLITDMTLHDATDEELARAVRHSMVVIDAYKHHLDYQASADDNGIEALKEKYQLQYDDKGNPHLGASTLISKSKSDYRVLDRKPGDYFSIKTGERLTLLDKDKKLYVNPETGEIFQDSEKQVLYADPKTGKKVYRETGEMKTTVSYKDSDGKKQTARVFTKDGKMYYKNSEGKYVKVTSEKIKSEPVTEKSTKMAEIDDAHKLSTGTIQEELYADYANQMKSLANRSRKEAIAIKDITYSPASRKTYEEEVESLDSKLNEAMLNAPKERKANMIVASQAQAIFDENPHLTDEEKSKIKTRLVNKARITVGAKRKEIYITDKEWEAIQAGAITPNKLKSIIGRADKSRLSQLSMPRKTNKLSSRQVSRLKSLSRKGYTNDEIAKFLGISTSTVVNYLTGKESE